MLKNIAKFTERIEGRAIYINVTDVSAVDDWVNPQNPDDFVTFVNVQGYRYSVAQTKAEVLARLEWEIGVPA